MKYKYLSTLVLGIILANSVSAVEWIFDYSKGGSVNLSKSFGTAGEANSGWWYYMDGSTKKYIEGGSIATTDTLSLGSASMTAGTTLSIDTDITVAGMTFASTSSNRVTITGANNKAKLTVAGDVDLGGMQRDMSFNQNGLNLQINGKVYNTSKFLYFQNTYQVKILGGLDVGSSRVYFGSDGSVKERVANGTNTFANGLANPDLVTGTVKCDGIHLMQLASQTTDLYYQVGGLSGYCGATSYSSDAKYTTNLIFANTGYVSSYYGVREYSSGTGARSQYQKVRVVMNGSTDGIQVMNGASGTNQLFMSGGFVIISGTFRAAFKQDATYYTYKDAAGTNTITFVDKAKTAQTTYSHGDLEMLGGTFGSIETATGEGHRYGSFRISNLKYTNGKVHLRLNSKSEMDFLDMTSYYEKTVYGDASEDSYKLVAGGTVSKEGSN